MSPAHFSSRLSEIRGELSTDEVAMAAAKIPDRMAMAENDQPLADPDPDASVAASLSAEYWRQWNAGARIADDCFCTCCGRRGVIGLCRTRESSQRGRGSTARSSP